MKEPFAKDTDLNPVSVKCEKRPSDKDPNHVSCAPEPYVSPLGPPRKAEGRSKR